MLLGVAAVIFAGIAGRDAAPVAHQLAPTLEHAHVETREVSPAQLRALVQHGEESGDVVRAMHAGGVVAGAIIKSGGVRTLRIVVYDGEGHLKSLDETHLGDAGLSASALSVIDSNLGDELAELNAAAPPADEPVAAPAPKLPAPKPPARRVEPAPQPEAPEAPEAPAAADAAPAASDDAVSLDDVAALNATPADGGAVAAVAPAPADEALHLWATGGVGIVARSFAGPATLQGYSASPVGTVHVDGGIAPTARLSFTASADRALGMTTSVAMTQASTSLFRWDVAAAYLLHAGSLELSPTLGLGHRHFAIDSSSTARTPDADYAYLTLGLHAALPIGRVTVRALAAFEPVVGGTEPTAMAFGGATRWALDAGASLELRVTPHLAASLAFDDQRFAWSWRTDRASSGAVDNYPSGTLSLRALY